MSNYKKGSEWRKWDLHVHTPSSYDYKDKSVTNEDIINTLFEKNIAVVAITDHHIIDIDRIKKLQELGIQKGITVLPGIEFLSDARGEEPIHMIGIFAEDCHIEHIWGQLENITEIRKIKGDGKNLNEVYCHLINTINLVHELGGIITIHAGGKHASIESITNSLKHTMAQKTDIAHNVDIYELGKAEDQRDYVKIVFPTIQKRLPMVICSDNHNANEYNIKENCWIKADTTFEGLKQIIYEPENRVFIGERPEVLDRVESEKTRYIKSLNIKQDEGYNESNGIWFKDVNIELNKELVTIIGNKGSGKSALADILGLLGNTHNADQISDKRTLKNGNFSFLTHEKFLKNRLANNYIGLLTWEDRQLTEKFLNEEIDPHSLEKVRYFPQNYFEKLTNDLNGESFKNTLEDVVFRHLPSEQRMKNSFSELCDYKQAGIKEDISLLIKEIAVLNTQIVELERKKHPSYLLVVKSKIKDKEEELAVQVKLLKELVEVKNPLNTGTSIDANQLNFTSIEPLNEKVKELDSEIGRTKADYAKYLGDKETLSDLLKDLDRYVQQIESYQSDKRETLSKFGIDINEILKLDKNYTAVDSKITEISNTLNELSDKLLPVQKISVLGEEERELEQGQSLYAKREECIIKISEIKKELSEQGKKHQEYIENKNRIETRINEIKGSNDTPETLLFYNEEKRFIEEDITAKIEVLFNKRYTTALNIFKMKLEVIELFNEFKKPVDEKVRQHSEYLSEYPINIEVSFKLNDDFYEKFLRHILKNKKGSFKEDGDALIRNILLDKNINDKDVVREILEDIISKLQLDISKDEPREISDQIKNVDEFYSFLFSLDYLQAVYELKLGEKSLNELSPGEKGTLLLVFYLMIDNEKIPLIIDQPEDNLDNKSVFQMLTKFIKLAKKQRQIIIVTHNPNLTVGADAEQVIYVEIDKSNNQNLVSVETGSIENQIINKRIVEILEGTMPAFDKRKLKYQ